MDAEKLKQKGIEKGMITEAEAREEPIDGDRDDDAEGEVLLTSISGKPRDWSAAALLGAFLRMPFLTLGVIARIHWQALKLWLKGVPFRGAHPATQPLQESTK